VRALPRRGVLVVTTAGRETGRDLDRYCGARKRQGEGTCHRPAGWGTDHPGVGRCKLHGGTTPSHRAAAERTRREQAASVAIAKLGLAVVVDPQQALLDLVHEAAANVAFYRMLVAQLDAGVDDPLDGAILPPDVDPPPVELMDRAIAGRVDPANWKAAPHVLVAMYDAERDRLAKYSKLAIEAGLAEREVQLAERQGELVVRLITAVLDHADLGLSFTQREAGRRIAGRELRELSRVIDVEEVV
jgi:hypothetical protein